LYHSSGQLYCIPWRRSTSSGSWHSPPPYIVLNRPKWLPKTVDAWLKWTASLLPRVISCRPLNGRCDMCWKILGFLMSKFLHVYPRWNPIRHCLTYGHTSRCRCSSDISWCTNSHYLLSYTGKKIKLRNRYFNKIKIGDEI
jgi:hypothetical protein